MPRIHFSTLYRVWLSRILIKITSNSANSKQLHCSTHNCLIYLLLSTPLGSSSLPVGHDPIRQPLNSLRHLSLPPSPLECRRQRQAARCARLSATPSAHATAVLTPSFPPLLRGPSPLKHAMLELCTVHYLLHCSRRPRARAPDDHARSRAPAPSSTFPTAQSSLSPSAVSSPLRHAASPSMRSCPIPQPSSPSRALGAPSTEVGLFKPHLFSPFVSPPLLPPLSPAQTSLSSSSIPPSSPATTPERQHRPEAPSSRAPMRCATADPKTELGSTVLPSPHVLRRYAPWVP